jgi:transcription termination factor Rho
MENENIDVQDGASSTSAPAKRAPRRATKKSADSPIEVTKGNPEAGATEATDSEPAKSKTQTPRGRGRANKADATESTEKSASQEAETQNENDSEGDSDSQDGARNRQRNRKRGRGRDDDFDAVTEDEVLIPVAGILDILDNYAFVRTAGYLASPNDIYVALGQVKKYGLRKGDAIVGAIRQPRENDYHNRQKYNALQTIDFVNGSAPEETATREDFIDLTAVSQTESLGLKGRFGTVKRGDRVLIDAAPGTSRQSVIRELATEISSASDDLHLMLVISEGTPEDVTALSRGIRGEVSASSYDRHADEHVTVAELAVARAKRLVEKGHHVVVLIDSMTRLAKNELAVIQGARPMGEGGIDSAVFAATKRVFGAGRALEAGGSLTVIATVDNQETGFAGAIREELLDIATSVVNL